MRRWLVLILAFPLQLFAADEPPFGMTPEIRLAGRQEAVDLHSRAAVEFALLDYPDLHLSWFRQQLFTIDPEKDPIAWVRACWALGSIDRLEEQPKVFAAMPRCIAKAAEQKLHLEWTDLSYNYYNYTRTDDDFGSYEKAVTRIIDQVRTFDDPDALAFLLSMFSIDLMRYKILDRPLPLLAEAAALMETPGTRSLMAFNITKNAIGNSLRYRELHEDAITQDRKLARIYEELGVRMLTARLRYSVGFSLLFRDNPDYAGAREAMNSALQKGREIQDRSIVGSISSLLSLIASHYGEHDEAERLSREAVRIFIAEGEHITQAYAEKRLAEVLVAKGDFTEALLALEQAQKLMIDQNQEFKKDVFWFRYKSYLGLHDRNRALENLQLYTGVLEEIGKQKARNEYNRAAASLGLQLEQVKTKNLEQENRLQAQKLAEAERIRLFVIGLGALSFSTLGLLGLSLLQVRRVKASKRQMHRILDNIDEGLLTIDAKHHIGQDFSLHLRDIVGRDKAIAGQDFVDTVLNSPGVPSEQKAIVREVLSATLHEPRLAWELNAENLPQELNMGPQGEQIFHLRWIPIFSRHDQLEALLVSLTDVTQARALEKALGARDKKLRALPETLRELLALRPEHIENILHGTEDLLHHLTGASSPELRRSLHTQKGLARTLGLRELSQTLHDLEDNLENHPLEREHLLHDLAELIQEYRAFAGVLHQGRSKESSESWLASVINPQLPAWKEQLRADGLHLGSLQIIDAVIDWEATDLVLAQELCLHAINNSLDHGYIFPTRKGRKLDDPALEVIARLEKGRITLEINDHGVGLEEELIQNLVRMKGFVPGPDETVYDVLFAEGVSSAAQISLTSGRGVGLAAIRARIQQRGGTVHLENHGQRAGSRLRASWPLNVPLKIAT